MNRISSCAFVAATLWPSGEIAWSQSDGTSGAVAVER
jgi:hypothetical protein